MLEAQLSVPAGLGVSVTTPTISAAIDDAQAVAVTMGSTPSLSASATTPTLVADVDVSHIRIRMPLLVDEHGDIIIIGDTAIIVEV